MPSVITIFSLLHAYSWGCEHSVPAPAHIPACLLLSLPTIVVMDCYLSGTIATNNLFFILVFLVMIFYYSNIKVTNAMSFISLLIFDAQQCPLEVCTCTSVPSTMFPPNHSHDLLLKKLLHIHFSPAVSLRLCHSATLTNSVSSPVIALTLAFVVFVSHNFT